MPQFLATHISLHSCIPLLLLAVAFPAIVCAWTCENSCGNVPLNYPFGSGWNCGSPSFQGYVNCSYGKLLFYTPTGTYTVQSIDYNNNIMIVQDPHMSTCQHIQLSGAFGLPIGAPFSFANYDTVALIGCSSTTSLYSSQSCDSSANDICQSLYSCPGISQLGWSSNSPSSSCCVYSKSLLKSPPYEINLPLLECSSYSSVYHIGNIQDPESSWLYGIALQFNSQSKAPSTPYSSCYICQQAQESAGSLSRMTLDDWAAGLTMLLAAVLEFY